MTNPIKALCEKALVEFKHDPHAHYVEELVRECLKLLEVIRIQRECLLWYCDNSDEGDQARDVLTICNNLLPIKQRT